MVQRVEERDVASRGAAPLLAAQGISVTGDGAFSVAVPLLAATLTQDPLILSTVSAAFLLPWLLFTLPAGALADRWPRRRVMVASNLVQASALTAFLLLWWAGHVGVAVLAATVVLVGAAQPFFDSAAQSMIPAIVGRGRAPLVRVNSRFWALDLTGRALAGPALGSVTFAVARALPFLADVGSFLVSAALCRLLPEPPRAGTAQTGGIVAAIRVGITFLMRDRKLRTLVFYMGAFNGAFNVAFATLVLYAGQVLHVPAAGYGILLGVSAVGGVLGNLQAKRLVGRWSHRTLLVVCCLAQAAGWAGTAITGNAWIAGLMLAVVAASGGLVTVVIVTARVELTPDDLLGRVVSVFRLLGVGASAVTALLGGVIASAFGLTAPLYVAALILVVVALPLALRSPR
jgi:MFS family permease